MTLPDWMEGGPRPVFICPECDGFVDWMPDDVIERVDRYSIRREFCDECDYSQLTVSWSASDSHGHYGTQAAYEPGEDRPLRQTLHQDNSTKLLTDWQAQNEYGEAYERLKEIAEDGEA